LQKVAIKQGFARIFYGDPAIGGRYSVLSPFGLVPAAAAGIDVRSLLGHTLSMVRSCGADVPPQENPGVQLGLAMGIAGLEGRDKVTIFASPDVADFGAWAEQLIAESTGKDGKGLIPIEGETIGDAAVYGNDRFFIDLRTERENDAAHEAKLGALEAAGHPVVRIVLKSIDHIGQEFFRFEIATAVAGSILGINAVQPARRGGRQDQDARADGAFEKTGSLPAERPWCRWPRLISTPMTPNAERDRARPAPMAISTRWIHRRAPFARIGRGDYVALLAYIERDGDTIDAHDRRCG
jgi:transaldolase/glucose-6-phosphate isomerase